MNIHENLKASQVQTIKFSEMSQIQEEAPALGAIDLNEGENDTRSAAANTSIQRLQESDAVEKLVNLSVTESTKDKKELTKSIRKKKKAIRIEKNEDHYFSDHSVEPFDEVYYQKERNFFKDVKKSTSKKKLKSKEGLRDKSSKDQEKFQKWLDDRQKQQAVLAQMNDNSCSKPQLIETSIVNDQKFLLSPANFG